MRSVSLLILLLTVPVVIAMNLPGYVPDVLASLTQPLLVVYLIATLFLTLIARRGALFGAVGTVILANANWTDRAAIPQTDIDTIPLKVIHFNAGELSNHQQATDWIIAESPDIVFITQDDSELLKSQELTDVLPFRLGGYSHAILSHWTLSPAIDREASDPATRRFLSTTLAANVDVVGAIPLVLLSPSVPSPRSEALWQNALERLDGAARIAVALRWTSQAAMIAAADFNSAHSAIGYREFQTRTGLMNADHGFFKQATWPTFLPRIIGLAIDHVLVSSKLAVLFHQVGPNLGGDHRPVIVQVALPVQRRARTDAPPATASGT